MFVKHCCILAIKTTASERPQSPPAHKMRIPPRGVSDASPIAISARHQQLIAPPLWANHREHFQDSMEST
jgi:hypothetical protein